MTGRDISYEANPRRYTDESGDEYILILKFEYAGDKYIVLCNESDNGTLETVSERVFNEEFTAKDN